MKKSRRGRLKRKNRCLTSLRRGTTIGKNKKERMKRKKKKNWMMKKMKVVSCCESLLAGASQCRLCLGTCSSWNSLMMKRTKRKRKKSGQSQNDKTGTGGEVERVDVDNLKS